MDLPTIRAPGFIQNPGYRSTITSRVYTDVILSCCDGCPSLEDALNAAYDELKGTQHSIELPVLTKEHKEEIYEACAMWVKDAEENDGDEFSFDGDELG